VVYRLSTKGGVTPIDNGGGQVGPPQWLIGVWRAPDGIAMTFNADGTFKTTLGAFDLDAGTFTLSGNQLTTVGLRGNKQVVTISLQGNVLRIVLADMRSTFLTKVK
jgi:hypothetical protein